MYSICSKFRIRLLSFEDLSLQDRLTGSVML